MGKLSSREGPEKGGGGGREHLFFSVLIPLPRTESLVTDMRIVHKTFFSIEKVNASRHRALFQKTSDTISNNFSP